MAVLRWTEESQKWLRDIYDFIAIDNPDAAASVVSGIYEKAQLLKKHPKIGHRFISETEREVRILLYGHYRVAYLIKLSGDIDILGVFHGSLDIERYLL